MLNARGTMRVRWSVEYPAHDLGLSVIVSSVTSTLVNSLCTTTFVPTTLEDIRLYSSLTNLHFVQKLWLFFIFHRNIRPKDIRSQIVIFVVHNSGFRLDALALSLFAPQHSPQRHKKTNCYFCRTQNCISLRSFGAYFGLTWFKNQSYHRVSCKVFNFNKLEDFIILTFHRIEHTILGQGKITVRKQTFEFCFCIILRS